MPTYRDDFHRAEKSGGFFDLSSWGVVAIDGPDAREFLQRMTATDLRQPMGSRVSHCACLNGRGLVQALGLLQEKAGGSGYGLILSPGQAPTAAEYLEKFHFAENLILTDASDQWALFATYRLPLALAKAWEVTELAAPLEVRSVSWRNIHFDFWKDDVREGLAWIKMERSAAYLWLEAMAAAHVHLLGQRLFELLRIQAAVPQVGCEIAGTEILLETAFDRAISRNKGCYPGQEVIERIFTYGQVNRKLRRVAIERRGKTWPELPWTLLAEGKEVAKVVSVAELPDQADRAVGLAYVHRRFWEATAPFAVGTDISVTLLA